MLQPTLFFKYENIRSFLHPLKAVVFNEKAKLCLALFQAEARGLRITVEHGKAAQAVAYLDSKNCDQYIVNGEEGVEFAIDLLSLIRFLETGISPHSSSSYSAGSTGSATLRTTYNPDDEKGVEVHLESPAFSTKLKLKTIAHCQLQMEDLLGQSSVDFSAKVILQCDSLKEAFVDLDISSEYLTVVASPDPAYLRFSTKSRLSSSQVDFNAGLTGGSNAIIQYFHCKENITFKYRMSLFRAALRAMVFGRRVSLRIRSDGILALQFQLPSLSPGFDEDYDDTCYTYVDYLFRAVDDESAFY